jgi:hypothetical protein
VLQGFESDGTDRQGQGQEASFTFEGEHEDDVHDQIKPIYDKLEQLDQSEVPCVTSTPLCKQKLCPPATVRPASVLCMKINLSGDHDYDRDYSIYLVVVIG